MKIRLVSIRTGVILSPNTLSCACASSVWITKIQNLKRPWNRFSASFSTLINSRRLSFFRFYFASFSSISFSSHCLCAASSESFVGWMKTKIRDVEFTILRPANKIEIALAKCYRADNGGGIAKRSKVCNILLQWTLRRRKKWVIVHCNQMLQVVRGVICNLLA